MREIKFRAWDTARKEMLTMDYPTYSAGPDADPMICDLQWFFECLESEGSMFDDENGRYLLMQFTGLKDKNGKEIYEGDVLRSSDGTVKGQVLFVAGGFEVSSITTPGYFSDFYYMDEVIGNIYENPELIGEAK